MFFFEFKTTGLDDRTNFMYFDKAVNGRDKIIGCTACMCCESRTAQHTVSEFSYFFKGLRQKDIFPPIATPVLVQNFLIFFNPVGSLCVSSDCVSSDCVSSDCVSSDCADDGVDHALHVHNY